MNGLVLLHVICGTVYRRCNLLHNSVIAPKSSEIQFQSSAKVAVFIYLFVLFLNAMADIFLELPQRGQRLDFEVRRSL